MANCCEYHMDNGGECVDRSELDQLRAERDRYKEALEGIHAMRDEDSFPKIYQGILNEAGMDQKRGYDHAIGRAARRARKALNPQGGK